MYHSYLMKNMPPWLSSRKCLWAPSDGTNFSPNKKDLWFVLHILIRVG